MCLPGPHVPLWGPESGAANIELKDAKMLVKNSPGIWAKCGVRPR
jgi:hypothetical protein